MKNLEIHTQGTSSRKFGENNTQIDINDEMYFIECLHQKSYHFSWLLSNQSHRSLKHMIVYVMMLNTVLISTIKVQQLLIETIAKVIKIKEISRQSIEMIHER